MMSRARGARAGLLPAATQATILAAIIVAALYFGRAIFVPLALAVLLSFVLGPPVVWLRKLKLPRPVAVGSVVLATVLAVAALGMVMARQVAELGNDLPRYEATLREKLKSLRTGMAQTSLVDRATSTLNELGRELDERTGGMEPETRQKASDPNRPIPVEVHQPPERPLDTYHRLGAALLQPLSTTGIVLLLVIFILMQREDIRDRVIRLAGAGDIETTTAALNDAAYRLSRLLLAQSILNVGYGIVIAVGLTVIGVPSAIVWGIVATLMRFIPYIGALLAAVFPLLLAAAVDPGWSIVLWTLALYVTVEPAVGHFLEPWVLGQTTGLSPLAIVVSAILWTALWGPIGLLLATPLTMCLVVLGRYVEGLAFLDVILGDQPALTPPQIFYQRLLAGSTAEAAEQAEAALATSTLVGYFDTVALPGLKLAAADYYRGVIDDTRMQELLHGTELLLDDVAEPPLVHKEGEQEPRGTEAQPRSATDASVAGEEPLVLEPEWRGLRQPVLCLGIDTPVDTAAAGLLALALGQRGLPARSASARRLADLGQLDLAGIRLVWLSSIESSRSHARIRYVVRRLRRLAPELAFAGAFWGGTPNPEFAGTIGLARMAETMEAAVRLTCDLATVSPKQCLTASPLRERAVPELPLAMAPASSP